MKKSLKLIIIGAVALALLGVVIIGFGGYYWVYVPGEVNSSVDANSEIVVNALSDARSQLDQLSQATSQDSDLNSPESVMGWLGTITKEVDETRAVAVDISKRNSQLKTGINESTHTVYDEASQLLNTTSEVLNVTADIVNSTVVCPAERIIGMNGALINASNSISQASTDVRSFDPLINTLKDQEQKVGSQISTFEGIKTCFDGRVAGVLKSELVALIDQDTALYRDYVKDLGAFAKAIESRNIAAINASTQAWNTLNTRKPILYDGG